MIEIYLIVAGAIAITCLLAAAIGSDSWNDLGESLIMIWFISLLWPMLAVLMVFYVLNWLVTGETNKGDSDV